MADLYVALPDHVVLPIQERMWLKYPVLAKYDAGFATGYIEPPYYGQLPDGTTGEAKHPMIAFIIDSEHPRPIQRKFGVHHVSMALAWKHAWELAEKERSHYVTGGYDPVGEIFEALAAKHARDLIQFQRIMN